eukprot:scaffold4039_cov124-Isochrysis_galbana.AAC.1
MDLSFTRLPGKGKELSLQEGRRGSKKGLMCWVRLRFPEGLRSARSMAAGMCEASFTVTSFDAMQPSGCRGVQAGRQAEAGCSCALRWDLRPPGFARSRGGAARRHLKQSVCCGDDGAVKIKVCRPNGPA